MRSLISFRSVLAILAVSVMIGGRLEGQAVFPRPKLPAKADTNNWEAYYDLGVEAVRRKSGPGASQAFYWASRLEPTRAEPLFGRWIGFWLLDYGRWERYLREPEEAFKEREVRTADSLRYRAMVRNPFLHEGMMLTLYDVLPGRWGSDAATKGWLALADADLQKATEEFGRAIKENPKTNVHLRLPRASAFVNLGRIDSAMVEMEALLAALRAEDARVVAVYDSKAMYEYAVGLLEGARGKPKAARAGFERALTESFAFWPARRGLADLARARGDAEGAARELAQAVELEPGEGWLRFEYGSALLAIGKYDDARKELHQAVLLEPYFAAPYLALATVAIKTGDRTAARTALTAYVAHALNDPTILAGPRAQLDSLARLP